jgi:type II secretory pathway component PulM
MQISPREKRLLLIAVILIGIWGFFSYVITPTRDRLDTLERILPEKQATLAELVSLRDQYLDLQKKSALFQQQIQPQPADFALLAYLEKTAEQCDLDPSTMAEQSLPLDADLLNTTVTMDLIEISQEKLFDFISKLRSCPAPLRIQSFHLTQSHAGKSLDATLVISHFHRKSS